MISKNAIRGIAIAIVFLTALLLGIPLRAALTPEQRKLNIQSFEYVWTAIRDKHWQTMPGGLDWQAIHDEYRPKIDAAVSMDATRSFWKKCSAVYIKPTLVLFQANSIPMWTGRKATTPLLASIFVLWARRCLLPRWNGLAGIQTRRSARAGRF